MRSAVAAFAVTHRSKVTPQEQVTVTPYPLDVGRVRWAVIVPQDW